MPHFPTPTKKVKAKKIGYLLITSATVNMTKELHVYNEVDKKGHSITWNKGSLQICSRKKSQRSKCNGMIIQ